MTLSATLSPGNRCWNMMLCSASGPAASLEDRLADHMMACWQSGTSSLRT